MFDKDPNQTTRAPGYGQAITSADLRKIVALILQTVKGGRGILVARVGQSVVINVETGGAGRGNTGGAWMIYADTFAALPTPTVINQFARILTGADKGMTCVVNADVNGWVSFTHFT